jgi:hypothetical protein
VTTNSIDGALIDNDVLAKDTHELPEMQNKCDANSKS